MITEATDDRAPVIASVNDRPERTAQWPVKWMIDRSDGSIRLYMVARVYSGETFKPFPERIKEAVAPDALQRYVPEECYSYGQYETEHVDHTLL